MKKMQKNVQISSGSKGITIVTLTITIIVMLILSGISLNYIIGDGIFSQTILAKEKHEIAQYKERIELARASVALKNMGEVTLDNLIARIYKEKIVPTGSITKIDDEEAKVRTKEGYIFLITGDGIEFVGKGEDVVKPPDIQQANVNFKLEPEGWSNTSIKVAIEANLEEQFKLQYSLDTINWYDYLKPVEITENKTIYACIRNAIGEQGNYASRKIETIDKVNPKDFEPQLIVTTNSITIDANEAQDGEDTTGKYKTSGIKEIWYSKDAGITWQTNEDRTKTTYKYEKLTTNQKCSIQVKAIDNAGNQITTKVQEVTIGTVQVAQGNLSIEVTGWAPMTHEATVAITKGSGVTSELSIQYQVVSSLTEVTESGWKPGTSVSGVRLNQYVCARLWDGYNGGSLASLKVTETTAPTITPTITATSTNSIAVSVTSIDNQSGMPTNPTYTYYIKKKSATDYGTYKYSGTNTSYTFTGLEQNVEYTIKVTARDNANNEGVGTVTKTTSKQLVTSITLNKTTTTITVGKTETLTATVLPTNANNKNVTWSSSNTNVATVSGGIVTAVSAGTATIKAIAQDGSGVTASCQVTIVKATTIDDLKAGDYIKYDTGENGIMTFRILYPVSSEHGLQIISNKSVKDVTIGVEGKYEKSVDAYNNIIVELNNYAQEYINKDYAYDARCVGSAPTVQNGIFVNKNKIKLSGTTNYVEQGTTSYKKPQFTNANYKNSYDGDINHQTDKTQLENEGLWSIGEKYWLASRQVESTSSECRYRVRNVREDNVLTASTLTVLYSGGTATGTERISGFRPCISLRTNNIRITGGTGADEENAYTIEKIAEIEKTYVVKDGIFQVGIERFNLPEANIVQNEGFTRVLTKSTMDRSGINTVDEFDMSKYSILYIDYDIPSFTGTDGSAAVVMNALESGETIGTTTNSVAVVTATLGKQAVSRRTKSMDLSGVNTSHRIAIWKNATALQAQARIRIYNMWFEN